MFGPECDERGGTGGITGNVNKHVSMFRELVFYTHPNEKFSSKMMDYMLYKNIDGKYLTLEDCIKENTKSEETAENTEGASDSAESNSETASDSASSEENKDEKKEPEKKNSEEKNREKKSPENRNPQDSAETYFKQLMGLFF